MTEYPYKATILGKEREVRGWTKDRNLILDDRNEWTFKPVREPVFDFTNPNRKLITVESLVLENGAWVLDGKPLRDCKRTALYRFLNGPRSPFPDYAENISEVDVQNPANYRWQAGEVLPPGLGGERRVWTDPRLAVCAVAWFAGVEDPVLLRSFWEIVSGIQLQTQSAEPIQPLQINETFLWHIQQQIQDKLDIKLRSAPVASQVFICFCRDKHTLAEMHRRNKKWSESTIKLRIRSLRAFLKKEFNGLTLESFFVDRSIFSAAEKQLADYRAKNISPLSVGELHNKDSEND